MGIYACVTDVINLDTLQTRIKKNLENKQARAQQFDLKIRFKIHTSILVVDSLPNMLNIVYQTSVIRNFLKTRGEDFSD